MRVLICPDKFRGTLTARQAADAFAAGWRAARPGDELDLVPMADGCEGTLDALTGPGRIVRITPGQAVTFQGSATDPDDDAGGGRADAGRAR